MFIEEHKGFVDLRAVLRCACVCAVVGGCGSSEAVFCDVARAAVRELAGETRDAHMPWGMASNPARVSRTEATPGET